MTAIILAGGNGSRLRPLTCSETKAMLPICNVPLIEYNFSTLKKHGFNDIIIAADRFSKSIADYFDSDRADIPKLSLSSSPRSITSALQQAILEWDIPKKESILVINGGALADFNYSQLFRHHKVNGNILTMVLKKSPRPFDSITAIEENGILKDFALCQPRESCLSDLVLTGNFIISAALGAHISDYGEDIDALSSLISSGVKVNTFTEEGYFSFLRTSDELLAINSDVLEGVFPYSLSKFTTGCDGGKICIGANADIDEGAKIYGGSIIGKNVTIGKGAKIHGAIVNDGVYIGNHCTINQAIIGKSAHISEGAAIFEGTVIGENAVIEENASVNPGIKIWNGRHIEPFACVANDLKYGFARTISINDEGITGETNSVITPQTAAIIGSSLVSVGRKICIGYKGGNASEAFAMAISSGVMAAGGEAWLFGDCSEPELAFCTKICGGAAGCYIDSGITTKIKFFSSDGLPFSRREEKIIENGINRGEYRRSRFMRFGITRQCQGIKELYLNHLMKHRPTFTEGTKAVVNTSSGRISDICQLLLRDISDKNGTPIVFHISGDGAKVSAYTEETGYVFHDKLMLLCCRQKFKVGENVALPYDFPTVAEGLAEKYGCRVERYSSCSDGKSDLSSRALAGKSDFAYDGIILMLSILKMMNGTSLKQLCEELPNFVALNRFVAIDAQKWHHMNILRELCSERQVGNDGIIINDKRGRVLIRPVKTGKGVMMHVESYAVEAASELCDFYQDTLTTLAKKGLLK